MFSIIMCFITAPTLGGGWTGSIKVRATLIEVFSTEICLSFIFIIYLNVKNRAVGVKNKAVKVKNLAVGVKNIAVP